MFLWILKFIFVNMALLDIYFFFSFFFLFFLNGGNSIKTLILDFLAITNSYFVLPLFFFSSSYHGSIEPIFKFTFLLKPYKQNPFLRIMHYIILADHGN